MRDVLVSSLVFCAVCIGLSTTFADAGECEPLWTSTFAAPSTSVSGSIYASIVFDDGSGLALYVGGAFTTAGGVTVNRIAKWNGNAWSALDGGMNGAVWSLAVYDDGSGSGPVLYAGGEFTTAGTVNANRIAKWNGAEWSPLGSGMSGGTPIAGRVSALTVFDDGSGAALYAGGYFTEAGGVTVNRIAKWDGTNWSALGTGMDKAVSSLAVYDNMPGSSGAQALYAGGDFTIAGDVAVGRVAKWDGRTWSAVGNTMNAPVYVLHVFDDGLGAGPMLYAGGTFTSISGVQFGRIAKWDGKAWQPLGVGLAGETVRSMAIFDDGTGAGPVLYVGGGFTSAGGIATNFIAKWNGTMWSTVGAGFRPGFNQWIYALVQFDDPPASGGTPALYAAGNFTGSPGGSASIAKWSGCSPEPQCNTGDVDCDGVVAVPDLLLVMSNWGPCSPGLCAADVNSDGVVNVQDLLIVIANWG